MNSLSMKISEMENNLMDINIKAIGKMKFKSIKSSPKNQSDLELFNDYNYYVKLIKRIKKCIKLNQDTKIILRTEKDKNSKIVYIVTKIYTNEIDIGIPISIRIITGNSCKVFMDCTYYEKSRDGYIFINNFQSTKPNLGYGTILLINLDILMEDININLIEMGFKEIKIIKGILIPNERIINEKDLRKMYIKHGFEIDYEKNMKRVIKNKVYSLC